MGVNFLKSFLPTTRAITLDEFLSNENGSQHERVNEITSEQVYDSTAKNSSTRDTHDWNQEINPSSGHKKGRTRYNSGPSAEYEQKQQCFLSQNGVYGDQHASQDEYSNPSTDKESTGNKF